MTRRALVVDDDAVSRLVLCHMLRISGFQVDEAADVGDAVGLVETEDYDLVISDFHLPSGTGIDILNAAEGTETAPQFVLVTGIIEYSTLPADMTTRLAGQLTKPVSSETLANLLADVFPIEDTPRRGS